MPDFEAKSKRPYYPSAEFALHKALRARRERLVLGATNIVREALFSAEDRQVLTAENDGQVRIWDATTGNAVGQLEGRGRGARTLSADRRRILVGYDDQIVRLFDAETRALLLELHTLAESLRVVAFSPDGRRILTAGVDNSAVWDATTGEPKLTLTGPGLTVEHASFSPDGSKIVTVSKQDRTGRIWNAQSGKQIAKLRGEVWQAAFSPDGHRILAAAGDGTARLSDSAGNELLRLAGHDAPVLFADFSPDGRHIITTSADMTARLWDIAAHPAEGATGHILRGHTGIVRKAAFSGDGKRVVTVSDDLSARVWEVETSAMIAVLKGHQAIITSAAFSSDRRLVLTSSEDNTARVWDIEPKPDFPLLKQSNEPAPPTAFSSDSNSDEPAPSAAFAFKFDGNSDEPALFAAFSSDGKRLVTTYEDGTVRLWNGETGEAASVPLLEGHEEAVVSAVFSRDGNQIVTASGDGTARIWDLDSGNELARLEPGIERRSAVNSAVYSPDGRFVLTASKSGLATLWDGGKRIRDFRSDDSELFGAVFSPDGRRIVTASANRTARIWNAESGEVMVVLKGHTGACRTAIFSADGRQVLTAGDTTARLWSGTTGQLIKKLDNDFGILGAEFDHDGRSVLMMSQHKPFVYRWDVESGKAVGLSGTAVGSPNDGAHADRVARVAISADGRRIVTASNDGTARLWDGQTRAPIDVLEHSKAVSYAAISPDGRRVVTTSRDGTARLWHAFVSTQELIDFARRELPRCLAEPQRQKFGIEMPEWCRTLSKWPPPEDR